MIEKRKLPLLLAVFSVLALLATCTYLLLRPYEVVAFRFSNLGVTVTEERFLTQEVGIEIAFPAGASVYYTTNGSAPDDSATLYTEPIHLEPATGDFPNCLLLKAVAYYADGTCSDIVTHTFFSHVDMHNWTQNLILSISGEPSELTDAPSGILYGDNVWLRGKESERQVYVEAISPAGRTIFAQSAGARVYGGASRSLPAKSLKLYARSEYAPEGSMFPIDIFGTIDANGSVIDKYDKLVLRNHGNDMAWGGFVLDDLNQQLATQAGHTDTKASVPAVYYLNGRYQGFYWLQENVCEEYLQDKFGGKQGHFAILEGAERQKTVDPADSFTAAAAEEFNRLYNEFVVQDLTDDSTYAQLQSFIDVESYLQYYAYNIYINNWDWPYNNYKCYRYYPLEGTPYGSGELDGRWRFLYHDMDYSFGAYELPDSVVSYNNLQPILDTNRGRGAPLLAKLLQRQDCKTFFISEFLRLMNNALSAENVAATLDAIALERGRDMDRFLAFLETTPLTAFEISWQEVFDLRMEQYVAFARERPAYMKQFLIEELDLPDHYFDN